MTMTAEPAALVRSRDLFAFELDFAGSLRCIPMVVRFKLDLACIKLSLRQWSRILREERAILVRLPCETPTQVAAYRAYRRRRSAGPR